MPTRAPSYWSGAEQRDIGLTPSCAIALIETTRLAGAAADERVATNSHTAHLGFLADYGAMPVADGEQVPVMRSSLWWGTRDAGLRPTNGFAISDNRRPWTESVRLAFV